MKTYWLRYVPIIFCSCFLFLSAISQSNDYEKLAYYLDTYKNIQVESEKLDLEGFAEVMERWQALEPDSTKFLKFVFNVNYAQAVRKLDFAEIKEYAIQESNNSPLRKAITKQDLDIIGAAPMFLYLYSCGNYNLKSPYKPNSQSFLEEINFYNPRSGEYIADIGAGQGGIGMLMMFANPNIHLFLTEIDRNLVDFMETFVLNAFTGKTNIYLIRGNKRDPNLPVKMDKIILRNTYHHFSKKKAMIRNIKNSLREGGVVFVLERNSNVVKDFQCEHQLPIDVIKQDFIDFGFELLDEKVIHDQVIMKYTLNTKK